MKRLDSPCSNFNSTHHQLQLASFRTASKLHQCASLAQNRPSLHRTDRPAANCPTAFAAAVGSPGVANRLRSGGPKQVRLITGMPRRAPNQLPKSKALCRGQTEQPVWRREWSGANRMIAAPKTARHRRRLVRDLQAPRVRKVPGGTCLPGWPAATAPHREQLPRGTRSRLPPHATESRVSRTKSPRSIRKAKKRTARP
jgi:hypothetical protein